MAGAAGPDPEAARQRKMMKAIRDGDATAVEHLISKSPGSLGANGTADSAGNRYLHRAARYGHLPVVLKLIEMGADTNARNKFGMVPLHHAAVAGDPDIVKCLIQSGGQVDAEDQAGRVPLHWACGHGHEGVVEALLQGGAKKIDVFDKEGWTPLHRTCQQAPTTEAAAPAEAESKEATAEAEKGILADEDSRRSRIAGLLISRGSAKSNLPEPKGHNTPLHLCAMNGYADVAQVLLSNGSDANEVNLISKTPLIYACVEEHLGVVEVLLQSGADPLAKDILHNGWNSLHYAIMQDSVPIVKAIVEDAKAKGKLEELMNVKDAVGRGPLVVAEDHFKEKVASFLKEHGQ